MMNKVDKSNSYKHVLKYTGLFGGIQGLSILVAVIRNKLVAMILGPAGMGLASLFNSTIKLVSDSSNLGLSVSAVKRISEEYENGSIDEMNRTICLIRSWCLITAIVGMLLCVALSPLLSSWTFDWGDHTLHFICLSPVVACLAVIGGELAILKGTRHLRQLAGLSIYNVLAALVISVPLYYYFGESGIVPSLVLVALSQTLLVIFFSYKLFPLRISFRRHFLREGFGMIKLGVAFLMAGVFGSGADFIIRLFLNREGSLDDVGLYSAGFMMTMTYAGMVFSAMETDYFPRLSAISDSTSRNIAVNRQIEVSLLIIAPMLVSFIVFLPIILPLLYSGKFLPVLGMMQIIVLAMYMRAIKLPVAYMPLAKGDSMLYLLMEGIYAIVIVVLVCVMFHYFGLTGTGVAITITSVIDFFMLTCVMHRKYHYTISKNVLKYMLYQLPIGIIAYCLTFVTSSIIYWSVGLLLMVASGIISLYILQSKTRLWLSLKKRFNKIQ